MEAPTGALLDENTKHDLPSISKKTSVALASGPVPALSENLPKSLTSVDERPPDTLDSGYGSSLSSDVPISSEDSPKSLTSVDERSPDTLDSGYGSSFSSDVPISCEDSPKSLTSVDERPPDTLDSGYGSSLSNTVPASSEDSPKPLTSINDERPCDSNDNDVESIEENNISNEDSEDIVTCVEGDNENLELPADPISIDAIVISFVMMVTATLFLFFKLFIKTQDSKATSRQIQLTVEDQENIEPLESDVGLPVPLKMASASEDSLESSSTDNKNPLDMHQNSTGPSLSSAPLDMASPSEDSPESSSTNNKAPLDMHQNSTGPSLSSAPLDMASPSEDSPESSPPRNEKPHNTLESGNDPEILVPLQSQFSPPTFSSYSSNLADDISPICPNRREPINASALPDKNGLQKFGGNKELYSEEDHKVSPTCCSSSNGSIPLKLIPKLTPSLNKEYTTSSMPSKTSQNLLETNSWLTESVQPSETGSSNAIFINSKSITTQNSGDIIVPETIKTATCITHLNELHEDALTVEIQEVRSDVNLSVNGLPNEQTNSSTSTVHCDELTNAASSHLYKSNESSNERMIMKEMSPNGPSVFVNLQGKQILTKNMIVHTSSQQLSSNQDVSYQCYPKHAVNIYVPQCRIMYRHWVPPPKLIAISPSNPHYNIDVTGDCTSVSDACICAPVEESNVDTTTSFVCHSSRLLNCTFPHQVSFSQDGSYLCYPKHVPPCRIIYSDCVVSKVSPITPNLHNNIDLTSECTPIVNACIPVEQSNTTTSFVCCSSHPVYSALPCQVSHSGEHQITGNISLLCGTPMSPKPPQPTSSYLTTAQVATPTNTNQSHWVIWSPKLRNNIVTSSSH